MAFEKRIDKDKELLNSKETEISQAVLESKIENRKNEIEHDIQNNHDILHDLTQKALELSTSEEADIIKPKIDNLENQAKELSIETKEKIEQESSESAIEHLPNYNPESAEAKLVEMLPASEKIQKRFDEKISPEMKEAISIVCGQVFNEGKYPYALIGSNCYIPHTEHSEKIPDDLDIIFGIKDLGIDLKNIVEEKSSDGKRSVSRVTEYTDGAYAKFLKLQEQGIIKNLKIEELRKFGHEKNGCVKINCLVKTSKEWKEMEAFAQNMDDEVNNQGKNKNGIINLGVEKQRLEVVEANGIKVNIGSEETAEELYLKNTVNEFGLYNLKGWENKGHVSAKALQRIFNIINLDGQKFEDSIDQMIEDIGRIDPPTEEARVAQATLRNLWDQFKTLPTEGPGLVNHIMEINQIKIDTENPREKKILSTEKAVNIITAETKKDMANIFKRYQDLENNYQEYLNDPEKSPEKNQAAIEAIDQEIKTLLSTGSKYKKYLNNANSADKNDFCVYAAMPQLRNQFILPVITRLAKNRKNLEKK